MFDGQIRFTAEAVTLDSDEDGFSLVVTDTDGFVHRINVQGCLVDVLGASFDIRDYAREARIHIQERARAGRRQETIDRLEGRST